jgi:hypothetical protein
MKTIRNRGEAAGTSVGEDALPKVAKLMHTVAHVSPVKAITMKCAPAACAQEPRITPEVCKSQLGERTYNLLRQAILQQQETFTEQLWDLHRLTRAQHRKVMLLPLEEEACAPARSVPRDVFSRSKQQQVRNRTMHAICHLPTVPASLRRSYVATSSLKDTCVKDSSPCTADNVRPTPGGIKGADLPQEPGSKDAVPPAETPAAPVPSGSLFASGLKGKFACQYPHLQGSAPAGFPFPEGAPAYTYAWAAGNSNVTGSSFPTTTVTMHGQPPVCAHLNAQYLAGEPLKMLAGDALVSPGFLV